MNKYEEMAERFMNGCYARYERMNAEDPGKWSEWVKTGEWARRCLNCKYHQSCNNLNKWRWE